MLQEKKTSHRATKSEEEHDIVVQENSPSTDASLPSPLVHFIYVSVSCPGNKVEIESLRVAAQQQMHFPREILVEHPVIQVTDCCFNCNAVSMHETNSP